MGYSQRGSLVEMFHEEPMVAAQKRTVRRVGDDLRRRVRAKTPIAKPPAANVAAEWAEARKRVPGTLHESWKVGEVTVVDGGRLVSIDVYTEDPVAPHVEWDTQPHLIVPHAAGLKGRGGLLRYWDAEGGTVFARIVHHPGTRGVHMMATALVEIAASWQEIGKDEMERWSREQLT